MIIIRKKLPRRILVMTLLIASSSIGVIATGHAESSAVSVGRELAHSYDHGNCLACHSAPTDELAVTLANIAPPLLNMKERFPVRKVLFKYIWDARNTNPDTIMPPFGSHEILSGSEIHKIIDYLYTL